MKREKRHPVTPVVPRRRAKRRREGRRKEREVVGGLRWIPRAVGSGDGDGGGGDGDGGGGSGDGVDPCTAI